ncbi:MAG: DNA polymerase III subunit gamma/tau [Bacteroidetes bacterium]|nr:DNA polymerase III subunit gamma/tau [Bacteroidota bacterium]
MSQSQYLVTARKYRPQLFSELVAQSHVAQALMNAMKLNRVAHAYLFTGPRGVGKTTAARILAKAINCTETENGEVEPCLTCPSCLDFESQQSLCIFEIDAASNNKVEDIRELRENVLIPPQGGHRKIYIIDEVHMLSNAAFNALLKTLEEPPAHVLFIFATTEPHKVLPTILSRCQRFDFRRIPTFEIVKHLSAICVSENITADDDALHLIAHKGDGALRDALSVFDQAVALCGTNLDYSTLADALRVVDVELFFETTNHIFNRASGEILTLADKVISDGYDIKEFLDGLAEHTRNLLVANTLGTDALIDLSKNLRERYTQASTGISETILLRLLLVIEETQTKLPTSKSPRLTVELALVKMTHMADSVDLSEAIKQIQRLEDVSTKTQKNLGSSPSHVRHQPQPTQPPTQINTHQPAQPSPPLKPHSPNPRSLSVAGKPALDRSTSPNQSPQTAPSQAPQQQPATTQQTFNQSQLSSLQECWDQVLISLESHVNVRGTKVLRDSKVIHLDREVLEVAVPSEYILNAANKPTVRTIILELLNSTPNLPARDVKFSAQPNLFPQINIDPKEEFEKLKTTTPVVKHLDEALGLNVQILT